MGYEGRGDIGVRFDRLNELRDGKIPELVGRSKGFATGAGPLAYHSLKKILLSDDAGVFQLVEAGVGQAQPTLEDVAVVLPE